MKVRIITSLVIAAIGLPLLVFCRFVTFQIALALLAAVATKILNRAQAHGR